MILTIYFYNEMIPERHEISNIHANNMLPTEMNPKLISP